MLYSAIFCAVGFGHSLYAVSCTLAPSDGGVDSISSIGSSSCPRPLALSLAGLRSALLHEHSPSAALSEGLKAAHVTLASFLHAFEHAVHAGTAMYTVLLVATVPANLFAALYLASMAAEQLFLVARNRTTLDPHDTRYDVGLARNFVQVFGERPWLWPLPFHTLGWWRLQTTSAAQRHWHHIGDGYEYPLSPRHSVVGRKLR